MWPLLRLWIESNYALRIVCVIVVLGWLLSIGMFVLIAVVIAARAEADFLFSRAALMAFALCGGAIAVANFLLLFPKCARCSRLLFDDGARLSIHAYKPDIRHHQGKTFLNSYRSGSILGLATTGRLNCSWCGHELGKKPDYVVVAPG